MLRFGIISEMGSGENTGFARVYFDEADMVSGWLPLPSFNTRNVKLWIPVGVNSQVACQMDGHCERGYISMVLWSDADRPPEWAGEDTYGIQFADGTEFFYDSKNKKMLFNASGSELDVFCKKLNIKGEVNITGETKIKGNTSVDGEVTARTAGITIKLTKHKHPTPSGVSGEPTI